MKLRILAVLVLLLAARLRAGGACAEEAREARPLSFARSGAPVRSLDPAGVVTPVDLTVRQPEGGAQRTWRAYPLRSLLEAAYGPSWKQGEELVVLCADGYKPSLPVSRFLQFEPLLAFEDATGGPFTLPDGHRPGHDVPLGPYYLVWNNVGVAELEEDPGHAWPYQVVGFDLVRFEDRYPLLALPSGAGADAERGQEAWRTYCLACHRLNGQGGTVGPELNVPASVTDWVSEEWLVKWILDPRSVRRGTPMPGLPRGLRDRERVAADLVAYLRAMARNKKGD